MTLRNALTLTIFFLTGITGYMYEYLQHKKISSTEKQLSSFVQKKHTDITAYISEQFKKIEALALEEKIQTDVQITNNNTPGSSDFKTSQENLNVYLKTISQPTAIISRSGVVIATNEPLIAQGTDFSQNVYRQSLIGKLIKQTNETLIATMSTVGTYPTFDQAMLFAATPIVHDGQLIGFVLAEMPFQHLLPNAKGKDNPYGFTWLIVQEFNKSPVVLDQNNLTSLINFESGHTELYYNMSIIKQATSGTTGTGFISNDIHKKYLASWCAEPFLQWGIIAYINFQQITKSLHWLFIILVIISIFSLLLILNASYHVLRLYAVHQNIELGALLGRMALYIAFVIALFFSIFSIYRIVFLAEETYSAAQNTTSINLHNTLQNIDATLFKIRYLAKSLAIDATSRNFSEDQIVQQITYDLETLSDIYACTIAFVPNSDGTLYAPTYLRKDDDIVKENFADYFDYSIPNPEGQPQISWYDAAIKDNSFWTSPYTDVFNKKRIVTYAVPFYNEKKELRGVIAYHVDIQKSIEKYVNLFSNVSEGNTIIITDNLELLYESISDGPHANDHDLIYNPQLNPTLMNLLKTTLPEEGFLIYTNPESKEKIWVWYETIGTTNWHQLTLLKQSFIKLPNLTIRHYILILITCIIITIMLLFIILFFSWGQSVLIRTIGSVLITALLLLGIGVIWSFARSNLFTKVTKGTTIVSEIQLEKIIDVQRFEAVENKQTPPEPLLTGIAVHSLKISSNHNILLGAYVWQKYDKVKHKDIERGIHLPQILPEYSSVIEIYRKENEKTETICWEVYAEIIQKLNISKYPLDETILSIAIQPKDKLSPLILVPDLATSGLSPKNLTVDRFDIVSNYFEYRPDLAYDVQTYVEPTTKQPDNLTWNVHLDRTLLNPIISELFPLFIIFLVLFVTQFLGRIHQQSTRQQSEKVGVAFAITSAYIALFFSLILIHTNLRTSTAVDTVLYIEYFFFCAYFTILILQCQTFMMIIDKRFIPSNVTNYVFWPLQAAAWFIITVISFYNPL